MFIKRQTPGLPVRLLEAGFWLFGCLTISLIIFWSFRANAAQREATDQFGEEHRATSPAAPSRLGVIGRLQSKEIGLSVPIVSNIDPDALIQGVGHIRGSAFPGGLGNSVIAGHRDTFFRPLRHIEKGMKLEARTAEGRWEYVVDRTEVVTPDHVDILDVGDRPEMTLITCYPFEYVGAAPKRFIVHAYLISADPGR